MKNKRPILHQTHSHSLDFHRWHQIRVVDIEMLIYIWWVGGSGLCLVASDTTVHPRLMHLGSKLHHMNTDSRWFAFFKALSTLQNNE